MTEVKPALTPEQWASFPNWPDAEPKPKKPHYYPTCHGIAAANLHELRYFTHEHVELLREVAGNEMGMTDDDTLYKPMFALADLIEALLPPEAG